MVRIRGHGCGGPAQGCDGVRSSKWFRAIDCAARSSGANRSIMDAPCTGCPRHRSQLARWPFMRKCFVQHFEETGLTAMDIPKALVIHETLGIGLLGSAWAGCYHLEPTMRGFAAFGSASTPMIESMESARSKLLRWSSWTSRVPLLRRADQAKLLVSLAESSVARKLIAPATVPLKLWASCYITLLLRDEGRYKGRGGTGNNGNGGSAPSE